MSPSKRGVWHHRDIVQQDPLGTGTSQPGRTQGARVVLVTAVALAVAVAGITVATAATGWARFLPGAGGNAAITRHPAATVGELPSSPTAAAARLASQLFTRAPVVIVASSATPAGLATAVAQATRAHAPLLLGPAAGSATDLAALRAAVRSLQPKAVLAAGLPADSVAAVLPHTRVVTSAQELPRTTAPARLQQVAVLVDKDDSATPAALGAAAATTAMVAGARVIWMSGPDPRTDPAAVSALAAARPQYVVGVGSGLGPASQLAARVAVAETGVQLPGGGQVLFPGRELVALYGTPRYPALGALGQQG
ncbi:MAG: hypothetical protein J2P29_16970, partial [Actinobacteria bacterium]|nr:hypothetical protein [Actinomycetota bacterium]